MTKVIQKQKQIENLIIGKKNISVFLIGLLTIVIGFILMAQPPVDGFLSRTLAPVLLVIAYLIIFPISIMIKEKNNQTGG
ncbi:MAG: hypothetical protein JXR46_05245 [Calditrichaceae bacterium]|nr:hypothetical protein [Calditrichaceae bacterium]RQV96918.1 MAG: hypothetical protein EH224_03010 [Calditrichota bacterium]